jgi:hypothetical protein
LGSDLRNRLRRRPEKVERFSGQKRRVRNSRNRTVEVDYGSELSPEQTLDELDGISFCEIGLNWEEQAELIEQAEARILWDLW